MNIRKNLREELSETKTLKSITNSNVFKNWFRNSEMVNSDGEPMIFYHGSKESFDKFDKSKNGTQTDPGWLGEGFYFYTDIHEARQYGKVNAYFLNIENPYYASDEENKELAELNSTEASKQFTKYVKSEGCDGVFYNGNLRGETVVFEPNQIWKIDSDIKI